MSSAIEPLARLYGVEVGGRLQYCGGGDDVVVVERTRKVAESAGLRPKDVR
jgi:hypothetical protein